MSDIRILDACCGSRMFWFDKNESHTTFMDIRQETFEIHGKRVNVNPDVVGDFRDMPFEDNSFNLVVFDPPHLKWAGSNSIMKAQYGQLDKVTWSEDLSKGFNECMRVLKVGGTLVFKWSDCQINVKKLIEVIPYPPTIWTTKRDYSLDDLYEILGGNRMNAQEAIEELMSKSREIIFGNDENVYLSRKRTIELVSQIDEPQKVVIPQPVADYIKEYKDCDGNIYHLITDYTDEIGLWLDENYNQRLEFLARAWLDGYEVEQEPLYTVQIPDPNCTDGVTFLYKEGGKVLIGRCLFFDEVPNNIWKNETYVYLTEAEIKEDFAWAWEARFAEPVEVE